MVPRGLIVAAPRSGAGKTTVTLAILAALRRRGVAVRSAKSGPDYIDPEFHAAATGAPSPNLDSWAMPPALLDAIAGSAAAGAELLVIESAMGLFDGLPGLAGRGGSAADLASRYGLPVLLVLDISGQSQSAAAVARGFATHDPAVRIGGVLLNRSGSERHGTTCAAAIQAMGLLVLGTVPRETTIALPERHLGLVQAAEHEAFDLYLDRLADRFGPHLELSALSALAREPVIAETASAPTIPPLGQRIAVAEDVAFGFAYAATLLGWRGAGAEIVTFSPLADQAPDAVADAIFLPGGYPELHAGRLAANRTFMAGLSRVARKGTAIYGECGGYMTLGEALIDAQGERHAMAGLLPLVTSFADRKLHLGYRRGTLLADSPLGAAGRAFRGHEFHYASVVSEGAGDSLFAVEDAACRNLGSHGRRQGSVCGSFLHLIDEA